MAQLNIFLKECLKCLFKKNHLILKRNICFRQGERKLLYLGVLFAVQVIMWIRHHHLFKTKSCFCVTVGKKQKREKKNEDQRKHLPVALWLITQSEATSR